MSPTNLERVDSTFHEQQVHLQSSQECARLWNKINHNFVFFLFSDGQGYTGVYVAVDIGIRSHEESSNSIVDVFEMSKKLRRDRQGIICSLEHYNFTYQVRNHLFIGALQIYLPGK